MAKKVYLWECRSCYTLFNKKDEALNCEQSHITLDNLKVDNAAIWNENFKFPKKILLLAENFSGVAAEYELVQEGSVEDIYERLSWTK